LVVFFRRFSAIEIYMYLSFFGLKEKPFSITPDPRYLFMSERHAEALAHLMYGVNEAGGFVQLTGDIGTGKTTLVRTMLEKMPQHADVAVILNPRITPQELLLSICEEFHIAVSDVDATSSKALVDALNEKLLSSHAQGRRVIVIIDEAQNLSAETLEQVRLLTNLETSSAKLMQIILIGQPELRDVLAHSGLKQLAQRITGRYHLAPLSRDESVAYVRHRLKVAGATGEIFSRGALREVHRVTEGVPRLINVVCDRALLGAYTEDQHRIDVATARRAASEVFGKNIAPRWVGWASVGAAVAATASLAIGVRFLMTTSAEEPAAQAAAPSAVTAQANTLNLPLSAPAAPAVLDVDALLASNTETTLEAAFSHLFVLWGATFSKETRPCEQALAQGLECVNQKGSWGQLRILNRPAILSLTDDTGRSYQVVLTTLSDNSAHISFGGAAQEVSLSSLSKYWLGDYLVLWRPQTTGQRALTVGMRGDEVRWLRRGLDSLQSVTNPSDSDYFDEGLAKRVEDFQRAHRLSVDGIAGVQTQIALDSAVDTSTAPRLMRSAPASGRQS
jgi:general secretion pathway protein A